VVSEMLSKVVEGSKHLSKSPAYMVFAILALGVLFYTARVNHESVATAVAALGAAVFGGGAAKTFVDQKFGGGQP
jgi:hypothetical protein